MTKPRYKNLAFQATFDAMLAAANDKTSELYFNGQPDRGSSHKRAFWDGYGGVKKSDDAVPGTERVVCYSAGKVFAKRNPGIAFDEASWHENARAAMRAMRESGEFGTAGRSSQRRTTTRTRDDADSTRRSPRKAKSYVVYVIRNDRSKRLYVGSTGDVESRWKTHKKEMLNGQHPNRKIVADVEAFGIDSFRFSIISRHASVDQMLAKEQLVLNVFWGRTCCYNIRHEVIQDTINHFVRADKPSAGEFLRFLSVHAASKELGIPKSEIKRVMNVRPYLAGGFLWTDSTHTIDYQELRQLSLELDMPTQSGHQLPIVNYTHVRQILKFYKLDSQGLASLLQVMPATVDRWQQEDDPRPPKGPVLVLLVLLDRNGLEWFNCGGAMREFTAEEIQQIQKKYGMSDSVLATLFNSNRDDVRRWGNDSKSPSGAELKLLNLLHEHGVKQFLRTAVVR